MGGNKKLIKKILVAVVALIGCIYYFIIAKDSSLEELISCDLDDLDEEVIRNSEILLSKMIDAVDIY